MELISGGAIDGQTLPCGAGGGVSVTFLPGLRDQVRAHRAILRSGAWRNVFHVLLPLLILLNIGFIIASDGWSGLWSGLAWIFPLGLVAWLLGPLLSRASLAWQWRQNPHLVGPYTFVLDDERFEVDGPGRRFRYEWTAILRVIETRHDYLFFIARRVAYFIPLGALPAPDDAKLRALVLKQLGARAQLRNRQPAG